jgi:hypothetical protein
MSAGSALGPAARPTDPGALPLSIPRRPFVPFMIRGTGDRGELGGADMKVLLTLYGDETVEANASPEEIGRTMAAWQAYDEAAREAGVLLACEGLEGSHAATTVRVHGGRRHVTDGPFIETKEQLGGFVLLEVRDLDEAMEWAARTPWNDDGCSTEIRPVMDYDAYAARAATATEERAAS